MEKNKKNQGFSSFDFFTMMASVAIIFAVSTPIIKKNLEVGNIDRAQREARNLAFDLLHDDKFKGLRIGSHKPSSSAQRGIASISDDSWSGEVGNDPWGKPYRFRFLRNSQGMPVQIAVWSEGPDKNKSDSAAIIKVVRKDGQEQIHSDPDLIISQVPLR